MTTVDSWPKTLSMPSVGSWNSTTETLLLDKHYTRRKDCLKKGLLLTHSITTITIARISWTQINRSLFYVLISENENIRLSPDCKDKISTKKCKKLKKKGKCENKKIWKKCMDTCEKCTPGIIDDFQP